MLKCVWVWWQLVGISRDWRKYQKVTTVILLLWKPHISQFISWAIQYFIDQLSCWIQLMLWNWLWYDFEFNLWMISYQNQYQAVCHENINICLTLWRILLFLWFILLGNIILHSNTRNCRWDNTHICHNVPENIQTLLSDQLDWSITVANMRIYVDTFRRKWDVMFCVVWRRLADHVKLKVCVRCCCVCKKSYYFDYFFNFIISQSVSDGNQHWNLIMSKWNLNFIVFLTTKSNVLTK